MDAPRITTHSLNNVAVGLFDKAGIAPTERECNRAIYARNLHLRHQVFCCRNTCMRIAIQFIEPRITRTIALTMLLYVRWKYVRMKINEHNNPCFGSTSTCLISIHFNTCKKANISEMLAFACAQLSSMYLIE